MPTGQHDWKKQNLVTVSDSTGYYDVLKCRYCGKKTTRYGLGQPSTSGCPKAPVVIRPVAWWGELGNTCPVCGKPAMVVPREGHVLSHDWCYERDDGQELLFCPHGCTE